MGEDSVVLVWFSRMDSLMHLVHCVFVGHGYQNEHNEDSKGENIRPPAVASTTLHHRRWEYDAENNKDISPSPSLAGAFVFMGPVQRCDCFGLECCVDID